MNSKRDEFHKPLEYDTREMAPEIRNIIEMVRKAYKAKEQRKISKKMIKKLRKFHKELITTLREEFGQDFNTSEFRSIFGDEETPDEKKKSYWEIKQEVINNFNKQSTRTADMT